MKGTHSQAMIRQHQANKAHPMFEVRTSHPPRSPAFAVVVFAAVALPSLKAAYTKRLSGKAVGERGEAHTGVAMPATTSEVNDRLYICRGKEDGGAGGGGNGTAHMRDVFDTSRLYP